MQNKHCEKKIINKIQTTNVKTRKLMRFTQCGLHPQRSYQSLCLEPLHSKRNKSIALPFCSISDENSMLDITLTYCNESLYLSLTNITNL